MDSTFITERLAAIKLSIVAYEEAELALANAGVYSYTLDTGQSRQTVTRMQLPWIRDQINALYNRYATLETRLNNTGVHTGVPGW